jgi:hypothetical protein
MSAPHTARESVPTPLADGALIAEALRALHDPDEVIEVRAFHRGRKRTDAGYYDGESRAQLIEDAKRLSAAGAAVYINLNPIDPQLLTRYANRIQEYAPATATDANVIRRRWLLLDFDPVRPKDTSATDAQVEGAIACSRCVSKFLEDEGWPDPIVARSGNGMHLLYAIDLPNDDQSRELIKRVLAATAHRFDSDLVKIDQAVFNAARIVRLYGTVSRKGDHTAIAPWRLSRLVSAPARGPVVTMEQLQAICPAAAQERSQGRPSNDAEQFDLEAFLRRLGIESTHDLHQGCDRYKLNHCPFNPEHGRGEAAIFRGPDGTLGFKCQHASCADKHWQEVRALVDGARESRQKSRTNRAHSAGAEQAAPDHATAGTEKTEEWPQPLSEDAYHGLAGEIVRTIEPHTESDPAAILIQLFTAFGSCIGNSPHYQVEDSRHRANLFAVLVGNTSKARKGTSWGRVTQLFGLLAPLFHSEDRWAEACIESGLSSGEGLIWRVRDPISGRVRKGKGANAYMDEEEVDAGVKDKRLLVIEEEFASTLRVMGRDTNILSPVLRRAWDGHKLTTLTKNSPNCATGAHISIIGHITVDELRRYLDRTECANGFANRFLYLCVKRARCLPDGGNLSEDSLKPLVNRLADAIECARTIECVTRNDEARRIWHAVYPELSEGLPGLSGAVTSRAEAQVVRLALLYALLDESAVIQPAHLKAGLAIWEYSEASARYIFGSALGDLLADEIYRALKAASDGLTRTDISNLFKRNKKAETIGRALETLARAKLARSIQQQTDGRPIEVWQAC